MTLNNRINGNDFEGFYSIFEIAICQTNWSEGVNLSKIAAISKMKPKSEKNPINAVNKIENLIKMTHFQISSTAHQQ